MSDSSPFSRLVIRASAGSGKTYRLSARYLRLLLEGAPVDSILATTFTRKAAGEIQDRILARLGNAALSPENAAALSAQLYDGDANVLSQERLRSLAVDVVRSLHRLRICTLDAFFMQIAGGFAFEIGLPPGWRIVEDVDDARLLRQAIQASFAHSQTQNAVQLTRLLFKGDLRRSIENQLSEIVEETLSLYYQTTSDAWTRLKAPWRSIAPEEFAQAVAYLEAAPLPTTKTGKPNSNYVKALDKLVGFAKAQNWNEFLKQTLTQTTLRGDRTYYKAEFDDALAAPIERLAAFAKAKVLADVASQTRATWIALNSISGFFQRSKLEENAFRFDDLTRILARLQWENRFRQIVYRLDAKTSHLLLDEFQDASFGQWTILKPFAEAIVERDDAAKRRALSAASSPKPTPLFDALEDDATVDVAETSARSKTAERGSFFCVGDVKQAIYGWRGGVAEIFNEIESSLPGVETAELTLNWRSCPTVIETVNRLFLPLTQNPIFQYDTEDSPGSPQVRKKRAIIKAVENWSRRFTTHQTAPSNASKLGYCALEVAPLVDDSGVLPDFSALPIDATENSPLAAEIVDEAKVAADSTLANNGQNDAATQNLLDAFDGETDDDADGFTTERRLGAISQKQATLAYAVARVVRLRREFPNATIGVLTRTNKLIVKFIAALKKQGVDASEEGGAPLSDAPSVNVVLSALTVASHPGDLVAKYHLATVAPLAERFDITSQNYAEISTGRRVSLNIRRRVEIAGLGRFVAEMADLLFPLCDARGRERLEKLIELAFRYQESEPNVRLDRFIKTVRETKIESPSDSTLRVMSLHKSKGLEFDIVVLPELDAPLDRSRSSFVVGRKTPTSPIETALRSVPQDVQNLLPQEFQQLFEDALTERFEEALCLLYVAVTRPIRSLIAIVSPKKNASKTPSFASILRAGLAPNALVFPEGSPFYGKSQTVFASGVKNWSQFDAPLKTPSRPTLSASVFEPLALPAPSATVVPIPDANGTVARVARPFADRRLLFQRETPTGGRSARRWSRPGSFTLGKALHACFEAVRWLDVDGKPSATLLRERLRAFSFDASEIRRTLERFDEICETPFVKSLLSLSSYNTYNRDVPNVDDAASAVSLLPEIASPTWEIFQERPFSFLSPDDRLWRGSIDRLVLLRDGGRVVGADVIDFKTDRLSLQRVASSDAADSFSSSASVLPLPDAETLSAYRRQLEVYGAVVAHWYSLPPERISLRLAFVSEGFAFAPVCQPIPCQRDSSDAAVPFFNEETSFSLNPTNGDAQC
ncbi:MAG: UvrD-helicase domain-containing protein [Thermoguttaceae bacterium]|nr:UvrD-helicase domain-containing protein [Thermoguttaceae bacterium]